MAEHGPPAHGCPIRDFHGAAHAARSFASHGGDNFGLLNNY